MPHNATTQSKAFILQKNVLAHFSRPTIDKWWVLSCGMKKLIVNHYGNIISTRYYEKLPKTIICPHCKNDRQLIFTPQENSQLCEGNEYGRSHIYKSCLAIFELIEVQKI
jgi:hypothetical protein